MLRTPRTGEFLIRNRIKMKHPKKYEGRVQKLID